MIDIRSRMFYGNGQADFSNVNLQKLFFKSYDIWVTSIRINREVKVLIFSLSGYFDSSQLVPYVETNYVYIGDFDPTWNIYGDGTISKSFAPANITYYLNNGTEINNGVYWLDDVESGEHIEFIPPDPEWVGHTFSGWYLEADCLTPWSYETDIIEDQTSLFA